MILWLMNLGFAGGGAANEEIEQARSIRRFVFSGVFGRVN